MTTTRHLLHNPALIRLKHWGLINETVDYQSSNLNLKLAFQNPLICDKYQILYPQLNNPLSTIIDYNVAIYSDDKNELQVSYKNKDGNLFNVTFEDFCRKIQFNMDDNPIDIDMYKQIQNHINKNVNMQQLFPSCVESETINDFLRVSILPTADGWMISNLLSTIEKNSYSENKKNQTVMTKTMEALINRFSKQV